MDNKKRNEVIEVCLLAGKIMLQSGAETYRVEDTMMRMAASFGMQKSQSYVTPTGIIFSINGTESTNFVRIVDRSTNLQKVTLVNSISRRISNKELTLAQALSLLEEVETESQAYSTITQVLAASIASGCFAIMFRGQWHDFLPALMIGGIGFYAMIYFHRVVEVRFFAEFLAAIIIGSLAIVSVWQGFGHELDKIVIGSVMPLVPGLLITNAVRDLMAGHLISGLSKGAEAFLTAFAIGAGVAVSFSLL